MHGAVVQVALHQGVCARAYSDPMTLSFRAVLSPCVGICNLDDEGLCEGCLRSSAEIAHWSQMNDDQRLHVMETVLPERQSRRQ